MPLTYVTGYSESLQPIQVALDSETESQKSSRIVSLRWHYSLFAVLQTTDGVVVLWMIVVGQ